LGIEPRVLLLDQGAARRLLAEGRPELAFFAAWAMQERHGVEAQEVVRQALRLSQHLPLALREPMRQAILNVLSEQMLSFLEEAAMDPAKIPEGPAMRRFRLNAFAEGKAEGEAEGKAEAVLAFLEACGLEVSTEAEERIRSCGDVRELGRWVKLAATVAAVDELFAQRKSRKTRSRRKPS
jgi:hypothetical protein